MRLLQKTIIVSIPVLIILVISSPFWLGAIGITAPSPLIDLWGGGSGIDFIIHWSDESEVESNSSLLSYSPENIRIYRSSSTDGFNLNETWDVIGKFEVTKIGDRQYSAFGSISKFETGYLAACSGEQSNFFDGRVVVPLEGVQDGDKVYLYHEKALLAVRKPNIYLYSDIAINDTISVQVLDGTITESIPYAHTGSSVSWDVAVDPNALYYRGEEIPWLFYEAAIAQKPMCTNYGWVIEQENDEYTLNGISYSKNHFYESFASELRRIGLFDNEAKDFIEWWFGTDNKRFPEDGRYVIKLVDTEWVNAQLKIVTVNSYQRLRLLFQCEKTENNSPLQLIPTYSQIGTLILHEWGVISL